MRAIASPIDPPVDRVWDEPVSFPPVSSGDPTFASRTEEILRSMTSEPESE